MSRTPVDPIAAGVPIKLLTPVLPARSNGKRAWWRGGFEFAAASRGGSYHPENEDSYLAAPMATPSPSLVAVADGVGGGAQGKLASRTLIKQLRLITAEHMVQPDAMREWLLAADDAVAAEIARHSDQVGASTFVAALPVRGGRRWWLTWAGDCRAYRLTAHGELLCLTRDDTYENLGEAIPTGGEADDPARMVGSGAVDQPNLAKCALAGGELLLLCSDGVHKYVPENQIIRLLQSPESLEDRCGQLVAAAHANGGTDDATVVIVQRHRWLGLGEAVWWLIGLLLVAWGGGLGYLHYCPAAQAPVAHPVPVVKGNPDTPSGVTVLPVPPAQQAPAAEVTPVIPGTGALQPDELPGVSAAPRKPQNKNIGKRVGPQKIENKTVTGSPVKKTATLRNPPSEKNEVPPQSEAAKSSSPPPTAAEGAGTPAPPPPPPTNESEPSI